MHACGFLRSYLRPLRPRGSRSVVNKFRAPSSLGFLPAYFAILPPIFNAMGIALWNRSEGLFTTPPLRQMAFIANCVRLWIPAYLDPGYQHILVLPPLFKAADIVPMQIICAARASFLTLRSKSVPSIYGEAKSRASSTIWISLYGPPSDDLHSRTMR